MSIGSIDSEQALAVFIQQQLRGSQMATLIRQLQGRLDAGLIAVTWDGVTNLVTGTTAHALGGPPLVVLQPFGNHFLNHLVTSRSDDSFDWQVSNIGGTPPAAQSDNLVWIAVPDPG